MKVLVVEDNQGLLQSLRRGLEQEGFTVDTLSDGLAAQRRLEHKATIYDVVLLDIMLPGKDGLAICQELRAQNISTPILMLTARDTVKDKVAGLQIGADDYLVKPFAFDELIMRLHALIRRKNSPYIKELKTSGITLNPQTHRVFLHNKEIQLTQKEFAILAYLMRNPERVLTRQEILDHVWEYDFTTLSNLVDVKIKNLRKKIDPKGETIQTVWNVGYRFHLQ